MIDRADVWRDCQMVYLYTKNLNFDKLWKALVWKLCYILWPFGVYLMVIWYVFKGHYENLFNGHFVYFMVISYI
jgi:hypothetical protein